MGGEFTLGVWDVKIFEYLQMMLNRDLSPTSTHFVSLQFYFPSPAVSGVSFL